MTTVLGDGYVRTWAEQVALSELAGRTVVESLAEGVDCKVIWRAVWTALELELKHR
jgi:hypothetical protein